MRRYLLLSLICAVMTALFAPLALADEHCTPEGICDRVGLSAEEIAAHPTPNVIQLAPAEEFLYDRWYQEVNQAIAIHDAPNGNPVAALDAGFNYVTIQQRTEDGWVEINPAQWVRAEAFADASVSRYAGVLLPDEPLPYPVAWILVHLYPSAAPGEDPTGENPLRLRYTVVYLYGSVEVDGWLWYQIGPDEWVHQTHVAKIIPVERPKEVDTFRWVSVDLYEQVAIAYEDTKPVFATLAASGLSEWPTNEGLFHVYVRYPRTTMSGAEGKPDFYYLEEVPWTMYFDDDIALHGTYWHDGFGYRHSHGCVNLSITDAHWLYEWANDEFDYTVDNDLGPAVYVYSSGVYR